jgi:hypothetical protein
VAEAGAPNNSADVESPRLGSTSAWNSVRTGCGCLFSLPFVLAGAYALVTFAAFLVMLIINSVTGIADRLACGDACIALDQANVAVANRRWQGAVDAYTMALDQQRWASPARTAAIHMSRAYARLVAR